MYKRPEASPPAVYNLQRMYKQQKPLTLSSGLIALVLTAIVLAIASSANAQQEDAATTSGPRAPERRAEVESQIMTLQAAATSSAFSSVSSTLAATTTAEATWAEKRAAWQEVLNQRQAELARKRAELASTTAPRHSILSQRAITAITESSSRIAQQVSESILRLRNASEGMRGQVEDLRHRGLSVDSIVADIDQAGDLLAAAEQTLQGIDIDMAYALTSADPRAEWQNTKATLRLVNNAVQEASVLLLQGAAKMRVSITNMPADNATTTAAMPRGI